MTKIFFLFCICLFILTGCAGNKKRELAKIKSDKLLDEIGAGTSEGEFSPQYFTPYKIDVIQKVLKDNCDFKNRRQQYLNDWYERRPGSTDRISFLYACYLKCDSMRIIVTYDLGEKIVLTDFKGEKLREKNPMMIDK